MRLKKEQFKKILKECIVEMIKDGVFDEILSENVSGPTAKALLSEERVMTREKTKHLDNISSMAANLVSHGDSNTANMMRAIFEDTARTTLQSVIAEEGSGSERSMYVGLPVDKQQEEADKAQLDLLAGGNSSRWAAVAFKK